MAKNTFGQRLKKLRLGQKMTQGELALKLGISPQHLSNFEKGRRIPRLATFQKIAKFFNIDYRELLDITPEEETGISEPITLSDEQMDRFLADALYSYNPEMLEEAIREKQVAMNTRGVKINLKEFMSFAFPKQLLRVKSLIKKGDYSLFGLARELALNYISASIEEKKFDQISEASEVLRTFLRGFPDEDLREKTLQRIWGGLCALHEMSCRTSASVKNRRVITRSEKEHLRKELERKRKKVARVIPIEELRQVA